jgi:phenylalanyl-tRNA synthetase beta chain
MKISLNLAQQYSNVDLLKIGKKKLIEKIGAQLGEIDEVYEWGPRYKGIVVVKIVSSEKHPNADKLHVCMVDDGRAAPSVKRDSKGLVQVVCGASNVRAGMLAAWIPPGATVPATFEKDPFVLEARDLRGVVSNGMLASSSELGISEAHSGILEIKPEEAGAKNIKPGTPFKDLYGLDDLVVDVENKMFTHRPDCFGALGDARELAGIQGLAFKSPGWYMQAPAFESGKGLPIEVRVEDPELVPRFMAVAMQDVAIAPSPPWMQAGLNRVGIRPISNVVDITNFVMYLTGQPLHAYDYDKIKALSGSMPTLVARQAKQGEQLALLNGKTYELNPPTTVIATDKTAVGVGGVMGGKDTEVDENTKNIILECANFDMYAIRKTSMKYGLFTDAVTRFNKGQSPKQNDRILAYAISLIEQMAQGRVASKVSDIYHNKHKHDNPRVTVTADFVNERLGTRLNLKEMMQLLENVEFKIMTAPADKKKFHVTAPFWRTDIEIPEDVVEEIGRLYGYDHLPIELPERDLTPVARDPLMEVKNKVRQHLSAAGANELLTYSFVHGNLIERAGQNKENAFQVSNALSPDLQYYRMSLIPSLLDKVHPNIKAGYDEFALFEINQVHNKDLIEDGLPIEEHRLALVFAAEDKTAAQKYSGAPYYQALKYMADLLDTFGIKAVLQPATEREPKMEVGKAAIAPFDKKRAAYVRTQDGKLLGEIGEFSAVTHRNLKLPAFTAGFELDLARVLEAQNDNTYVPLPRFPKVEQDLSLRVPVSLGYGELASMITVELMELKPDETILGVKAVDIYQPENLKDNKHITIRITVVSYERTLKAEEVNGLLDKVAAVAGEQFGAERL